MVKEPAPLKVRQPVIVKVSGDLWDRNDVIEWIRKKAVIICCNRIHRIKIFNMKFNYLLLNNCLLLK